jgi:hypothetical protein
MRLLHGHDLATGIRDLFATEDELRCAVAFWGPELATIARDRGATVILDLSMRCTSKAALEAFGAGPGPVPQATGKRVRVLDDLHAKIYLGRERCIIGSANASGNALGRKGSAPSLKEAGVLIEREDDPKTFKDVEDLWRGYLNASRAVTAADFERAPRVAAAAPGRDLSGSGNESRSLLDAVLHRPESFSKTAFVFGDHDISEDDLRAAHNAYEEEHGTAARSHGRSHICTLEEQNDANDQALRSSLTVVSYWLGKGEGVYAYHDVVRIEHGDDVSYYGQRSWSSVRKVLGLQSLMKDMVWSADQEAARQLSELEDEPQGERYVAMTADAVFEALSLRRSAR